jgi:hypothetical protein
VHRNGKYENLKTYSSCISVYDCLSLALCLEKIPQFIEKYVINAKEKNLWQKLNWI